MFILSSWWAGGTHSAMSSIYNNYDPDKWDLSIYILSQTGKRDVPYESLILKNDTLSSAYFCNKREFKRGERFLFYVMKVIKKVAHVLRIDLDSFFFGRIARRIERSQSFDTVVAFIEGPVTRFGTYFGCPNKVAWIHCDYNKYLREGASELDIYSRYSHIVTVSEHTTKVFQARYPTLAPRTLTIYNLFDKQGVLSKASAVPDDARFIKSSFTVLSVGRIHPVKRFSMIPSFAATLKDHGLAFKWYIIGPDFDTNEVQRLRENIRQFGVEDTVIWLGGKNNPYPYFKSSDLYVCTSLSEACPMVFNESRILGLPVISTDFPSAYEFIDHGRTGMITSISGLADVIQEVMTNASLYDTLKNGALSFDYDNDSLLSLMDSIF